MSIPAHRLGRPGAHAEVVPLCAVPSDDRSLALALQARRPGAPAALVDRYGSFVQGMLFRVVGVDQDIPDLVQEVFLRALQGVAKLQDPSALRGWLGSLTVFTARSFLRQRRFRRRWLRFVAPEELPEQATWSVGVESMNALREAYRILDELSEDERIPFTLRRIEGMALLEISELCGVSLATTKRRIAKAERQFLERARQKPLLRERLEEAGRWRER